ncbi:hypothetical protein [Streptomyces sp. XH2]|uniref:hypothetical protein n=1 Tax=Streptomyces sp. XH2 TaxID=3412483 RepID=UPI003C7CE70D
MPDLEITDFRPDDTTVPEDGTTRLSWRIGPEDTQVSYTLTYSGPGTEPVVIAPKYRRDIDRSTRAEDANSVRLGIRQEASEETSP